MLFAKHHSFSLFKYLQTLILFNMVKGMSHFVINYCVICEVLTTYSLFEILPITLINQIKKYRPKR